MFEIKVTLFILSIITLTRNFYLSLWWTEHSVNTCDVINELVT